MDNDKFKKQLLHDLQLDRTTLRDKSNALLEAEEYFRSQIKNSELDRALLEYRIIQLNLQIDALKEIVK